jgi:hypothetical protein
VPWCIGGGWAIDLWLGRVTRRHADVDVVILRRDQHTVRRTMGEDWRWEAVVPPVAAGARRE